MRAALAAVLCGRFGCSTQGRDWIACGHKFHGDVALVIQFAELAIDVGEINFPGAGFVAPRDVGNMDKSEVVHVFCELGDEISVRDLFMKKIVEKLDMRIVYFAHDVKTFRG